jgi:hypothetical protein
LKARSLKLNNKFRIATWNVERPRTITPRIKLISQSIEKLNPSIIILTETSNLINLGPEYFAVKTKPAVTCPNEQWATIWTKWPVKRELATYDATRAVCALIKAPFGELIVYGTIFPYHMAGVKNGGKYQEQGYAAWELHEKSLTSFGKDLKKLISGYPDVPLSVAGDFNQARDNGKGGYGTKRVRLLLSEKLSENNIDCLTEENFSETGKLKPNPKTGKPRRNIDHICFSAWWHSKLSSIEVDAWDHFTDQGVRMSDHNGVLIDFDP